MSQANPASQPDAHPLMSAAEAKLRASLYLQQRLEYQDDYYQRRIAEFTFNADRMLWITAGLMGISTVISSYSVLSDRPLGAFITALLPAFAAAISAFRSLYQWQRQAQLYEDTWLALQQARLAMPDEDYIQTEDYTVYFPELVRRTEGVLRNEASQWGQLEHLVPDEAPPSTPTDARHPPSTPPGRSIYE
jgi:hypothetical protein